MRHISGAAVVCALMVRCGRPPWWGPEANVATIDAIADRPQDYLGSRVAVSGEIDAVQGREALVLGSGDEHVIVLVPEDAEVVGLRTWRREDIALVVGTVGRLGRDDLDRAVSTGAPSVGEPVIRAEVVSVVARSSALPAPAPPAPSVVPPGPPIAAKPPRAEASPPHPAPKAAPTRAPVSSTRRTPPPRRPVTVDRGEDAGSSPAGIPRAEVDDEDRGVEVRVVQVVDPGALLVVETREGRQVPLFIGEARVDPRPGQRITVDGAWQDVPDPEVLRREWGLSETQVERMKGYGSYFRATRVGGIEPDIRAW